MKAAVIIILFVGLAAAAFVPSDVKDILKVLQEQLKEDIKVMQVHALMDLDNVAEHIKEAEKAFLKDPVKGMETLTSDLQDDVQQAVEWTQEDIQHLVSNIEYAIKGIADELKPQQML